MITMKGQTMHLPKRAWRLGLFFIGILLAGGVLLCIFRHGHAL